MLRHLWVGFYALCFINLGNAAIVQWDGGGDGTNWHHPQNWSGDFVPTATNDVVINLPGTNATITITTGTVMLRSLQCDESLLLRGGTLTLTNGPSQILGTFSLASRSTLTVRGSNATLSATGTVTADGAGLYVQNGATLSLQGLSSYTDISGCCGAPWQATGVGSRLLLPGLTNLVGNPTRGWSLDLRALTGGRIEMTNLTTMPGGDVYVLADGTNSAVDFAALQRVNANVLTLEARSGGGIAIPQVTDGGQVIVTVRAGGSIPTTQLTNLFGATADGVALNLSNVLRLASRGSMTLRNGGTANLSNVASADGHNFYAIGGTTLALPALRSYADSSGCCGATWEANGAGSRLSFPALTNLVGNPTRGWALGFYATAGGRVEAAALTDLPGGDVFARADGSNSVIDFATLQRVNANLLTLEARNFGSILVPQLADGGRVLLTFRSGGQITSGQFTALHSVTVDNLSLSLSNVARLSSAGTVTLLNGGALTLNSVTNVDGQSFSVRAGSMLSLPGVRNYSDTSGCCGALWEANGTGAVLRLPGLTNVAGNPTWAMEARALAGGLVDLGAVVTVTDRLLSVRADGSNSLVNLGSLTEFRGASGYLYLTAQTRGTVLVTNLLRMNRGSLTLETGGVIPHAQLTNVDGSSFYARAGQQIALSNVTAFADSSGCCGAVWEASGTGAVVRLPALTNLAGNPTWAMEVGALAGGLVDLGEVTTIGDRLLSLRAEGSNSVVKLDRLAQFRGTNGYLYLAARTRGTMLATNLTRLNRGSLTLETGGVLPHAQLINVDGASFYARAGQQIALPNIASFTDSSGCCGAVWEANGTGAVVRLPALTNLAGNPTWAMEVRALAGGLMELSSVTTLPDSHLYALADGTNSIVDLSSLPEFLGVSRTLTLEARNAGLIRLDSLTRLNRATLALRNTGFLPTAQLLRLTSSTVTIDGRSALFTDLTDMRGTTFTYPNGGSAGFGPVADLVVTDILAPGAAIGGQPVQLVWTVVNSSTNAAPAPRHDTVFLSTDATIGNDTLMGQFTVPNGIAPGGAQLVTNTVILPSGFTGNRYFVVHADSGFEVFEGTNEANNLRVSGTPVITSAADLVVDSLTVPTNATFGSSATLTWRVRNNGSVAAPSPWSDRVYLSTNNTVSPGAVTLGSFATAPLPLAAGSSYTRTQTVALPLSGTLAGGQWFFVVKTDANGVQPESDENNNLRAAAVPISRPPLPDLAVVNIVVPLNAVPGQPISVSWAVTNQGAATVSNVWAETILLSTDAIVGGDSALAYFNFTNVLAPGASLARTQVVTIPATGPAGTLRVGVEVDAQQGVVESNETNNTTLADATTSIPATLTLNVSASQTVENAPSPALTARVSRNGNLTSALLVTLASSDISEITVAPNVLIPANVSSAAFDLSAVADGVVDGAQTVRILASAPGFATASNSVTVLDADTPQLSLLVASGALVEGGTSTASVTREGDLTQPLVVALATPAAGQLNLPGSLTIPANQTTASFNVLAVDDYYVESPRTYTITASAPGHGSAFVVVTVADDDLPPLTLGLSSPRVSESAEPGAVTLTITREFGTIEPLTVQITRSQPAQLNCAEQVTFASGELVKLVQLSPVNDTLLDGSQTVQLAVRALESLSLNPIPPGVATNLIVLDDDGPSLELEFAREWVCAGTSNAALNSVAATLTRRGNTNAAVTATLAASIPGRMGFPVTVGFAANQTVATFTVAVLASPSSATENITLTATAAGFTEAAAGLALNAECGPDLVISNLVVAASGLTDAYFVVNFREQNLGSPFAIVANPPGITNIAQRVFLSADAFPGDDTFLGAVVFDGSVNPYTFLDRSATFRLPNVPGNYWIVVQADGSNSVSEVSEGNNFAVSATPIQVNPAYTATVAASPHTALIGTPINLSGVARKFGTAQPVPFELVSLHLGLRGTTRVIAALTDANGAFSTTFAPLPGEAGTYTVGAAHPGVTNVPTQDTFTLLGMRATPASLALRLPSFTSTTQHISLANLGDTPLTGLTASVIGAPPEYTVSVEAPSALAPFGEEPLTLTLGVNADTNLSRLFTVRVTSAEGAVADVIVTLTAESLRPRLVIAPESLVAGVVPGGQRFVEFSVANVGGAASGPLQVLPPALPWLRVATPLPLAPLAPGASNVVTLQLTPAPGTPLGDSTGTILVSGGTGASVSVPFSFRVLSTNSGSLRVEVTDQFTYYAEGSPRVTNAIVELFDPASGQRLTNLVSDAAGIALFTNITEAYYTLEVTAAGHGPYRRTLLVGAGAETRIEALLNREVVQFLWNVVPTEIGDRTRITIEATFETVVPVPVVTVEPSVIDLANFPNGGVINLTVTNHGLLAAQQTRLSFSDFDCWKITPLISDLGTLAARSSMVVPVTICHDTGCSRNFGSCGGGAGGFAAASAGNPGAGNDEIRQVMARVGSQGGFSAASGGGGGGNCGGGALIYFVPCGSGGVVGSAPVGVANAGGDCSWHPVGGRGGGSGTLGGGGGGGGGTIACNPECLLIAGLGCIPGPVGCFFGGVGCGMSLTDPNTPGALAGLDCAMGLAGCLVPGAGAPACIYALTRCLAPPPGGSSSAGSFVSAASASLQFDQASAAAAPFSADTFAPYRTGVNAMLAPFSELTGAPIGVWINSQAGPDTGDWYQRFQTAAATGSDGGRPITTAERAALLAGGQPPGVPSSEVNRFLDRWNRTLVNWGRGIYSRASTPSGESTDFVDSPQLHALLAASAVQQEIAERNGYNDPINAIVEISRARAAQGESGGICARVQLKIDQEAVIARDAFRATLDIVNNTGSPLTNVTVDIVAYRANGTVAADLFGVSAPALSGLSAVDGSGRVNAASTGTAAWNLLPSVDAAPTTPVQYAIGGTIRYVQDGVAVTVPLAPVSITVHPLAQLQLTYFHQRDVLGDDPFTDESEPSVPYSLAVMVRNTGNGTARNLRITSAQPQIVENEKGLFIDFQIIATEVAGQNLVPSLTANFGDVGPGAITIGQWLFKSTLQGLFTSYSASFEHLDNLGDPRLSIITGVEIRELIRVVRATGVFGDGLPDLLVNDFPDLDDLPDTLYLSDGSVHPVSIVQTGAVSGVVSSGNLQVTLTTPLPTGWSYLRLADPANGRFRLARVVRSDGTELGVGTNVWTTDRTFVGGGRRPMKENRLHLLDHNSTGSYTLIYELLSGPDTTPPASRVEALPIVSGERIPVIWSGEDDASGTGLAFYDLFVSTDNGVFLPWLQQTTLTGSLFDGVQGHAYAFYSVATDLAGNRETAPLAPDATTGVNFTNTPPILVGATLTVDEGTTVRYTNVVADPDVPPQTLSFSLLGSVPSGASVHPLTGVLTWPTTEANGPGTNTFTVRVADNGFPSFTATGEVVVIVREVNRAPTLAPIAARTTNEGRLLLITNVASDVDAPANTLAFSLAAGAPAGATVNPTSGIFSWRPTEFQGGTTNHFTLIVRDNGQPSLSATQHFTVTVRDTQGDFRLSLGTTNLLVGTTNDVVVTLTSGLELTRLGFVLETTGNSLTNFALREGAPEISSLLLVPTGPNHAELSFDFNPALLQTGARDLAQLSFRSGPDTNSAIVPLRVTQLTGLRADGLSISNAVSQDGRVFVIGQQPLLDLVRLRDGQLQLTLYGRPETTNTVESTFMLDDSVWQVFSIHHLTSTFVPLPPINATNAALYWRAYTP